MEKVFKKLVIILSVLLAFTILMGAAFIPGNKGKKFRLDLFSAHQITENIKNLELNLTSVIYVKDEKNNWVEYQRLHGNENRIWASFDKMTDNLKNAFIAIEDETFYAHKGINWKRTLGAVGNFVFKFDDTEFGGSTITQQLIKNMTLDNDKSATRKIREIFRALIIEKTLNKDQILEAYLNTIALGNGICGTEVAANYYFNKSVDELSLLECVTIAAITKNPYKYNPVTGMEENKKRRNVVLKKMYELKMITKEEFSDNYDKDIKLDNSQKKEYEFEVNSYFVDALIEQVITDLAEKYNCSEEIASSMLYNGGYKIYSTVNPKIQNIMEETYLNTDKYFYLKGEGMKEGEEDHLQSAMTIMDYKGHIVGLVGGVGEKKVNRGLNRATGAPRQPGSTMKPIGVYALAIEKDIVNYTSRVLDQPIEKYYPDGKKGPKEWYGYYKGYITLDYAIRKSANTIPVRLLQEIGIDESYKFLTKKLGCKYLTKSDKNLSALALGGCSYGLTTTESAAAYAIFGNQGIYHKPTTYYKIERVGGEVVIDYDEKGTRAISPATATIMNHLLQGVVYGSEGTGSGISWYNTMKAYAKTGTSSESKDLWMVAGTPYYVGSVWCGFDKQQEIKSTSAAATVWRDVMKEVHKGLEKKEFKDSDDVYKKGIGYYKKDSKPDKVIYWSSSNDTKSEKEDQKDESKEDKDKDKDKEKDKDKNDKDNNQSNTSSENENTTSSNTSSNVSSGVSKPSESNQSKPAESSSSTNSSSAPPESSKPSEPADSSAESSSVEPVEPVEPETPPQPDDSSQTDTSSE